MNRDEVLTLIREQTDFRTGIGFDVHRLVEGRPLILGGVTIPWDRGLDGHSDADVLTHAAMDAVLGACGLCDIGTYFPDTDSAYKGADSIVLAGRVAEEVEKQGYELCGLDVMVMAQKPKLKPHIKAMKERVAGAFRLAEDRVGIKATTTEKLGFTGREEGISAAASALVRKKRGV